MNVGRVTIEKNLEAFLRLQLPGSKVVVGRGPQRDALMAKYPDAHFHMVSGDEALAACYNAADVFVFPSRTDTFGLVMLEALACGVPVAAYPATGPLDVIGDSGAGILSEDLRAAALAAQDIDPAICLRRAAAFPWSTVKDQFLQNLAPCQNDGVGA
jgi:glycosyltransferase involved in cell wall biosynthesis